MVSLKNMAKLGDLYFCSEVKRDDKKKSLKTTFLKTLYEKQGEMKS